MLEHQVIELREATAEVENGKYVVHVAVRNPTDRTLYAYGSARRILYDPATRKLTLCLHDQHIDAASPIAPHLPQPRFVPLESGRDTDIAIELTPSIKRIKAASERADGGPLIEELPIANATEITLEIAHQDNPFYYDPKREMTQQLKSWGQPIARAVFQLRKRKTGK